MIPHQRGDHKHNNKKWSNFLMPLFVALVVIAEIAFLGRLDIANKASMVNSWADSFYQVTTLPWSDEVVGSGELGVLDSGSEHESCEEWLEREDSVVYSRDFMKEPIFIAGSIEELKSCAVGCIFGYDSEKKPDAAFGLGHTNGAPGVLRSMESAQYYAENNIDYARRTGYSIVMTTSLSSDVPVGYFSWAEYDIMAPMQPKTEKALAAAFISNCAARNFRLQALEGLEKENIKIDSYGGCHRNHDGRVDKVQTLKRYKFSLAFENSDEEDYVTEKFFQSLVAGTIPLVVGAPNIQEFAPLPDAVLHIKELKNIASVAKTMKYLAEHPDAYNHSLRWKFEGPSDSFKALVDMAAVHSSCRLCIYLATMIRQTEEKSLSFSKRTCKCTRGLETVYHVYVRERGRFEMVSIFLRSRNLSLKALESAVLLKFKSLKHVPIWKEERPESIRGTNELKVYRIYPLGLTQRQALYTFSFKGDNELRSHLENNPCAKFETEQKAIYESNNGGKLPLTWIQTRNMTLTYRVILESLRMASIISYTFRETLVDVEYKGYLIPKGWKVMPLFRNIHHNPEFFSDPQKFDSSRFEAAAKPNTYMPFGNGVHACPGNELAKLEMLILIPHLVTKFRHDDDEDLTIKHAINYNIRTWWEVVGPNRAEFSIAHSQSLSTDSQLDPGKNTQHTKSHTL